MNEKRLESKLREGVKKRKGEALKFLPFLAAGFPDRIVLMFPGRIWFVEMKTTGKGLSPLQILWKNTLLRLGFQHRTIDSQETLDNFFKEIE